MSSEKETRMLLMFREDMEKRVSELQNEIEDLKRAISEIDRSIIRHGFRRPLPVNSKLNNSTRVDDDSGSIVKSRDGVVLGSIVIGEKTIVFKPVETVEFTSDIAPFKSFFIDRVLENMRATDESKAITGELHPDDVLSYEIISDGNKITNITINNYGGDTRSREIQSSLRWAFEKMYEKIG
jgi:hypothetical protein